MSSMGINPQPRNDDSLKIQLEPDMHNKDLPVYINHATAQ